MSDSSSITMHRKYVDPWDLDLREVSWRHSSDTTDCSADHQVVSLSSAAGPVSTRSEFVYVPGPAKSNKSAAGRTRARSVARYDCCQCSPSSSSLALVPPDPNENLYEYWEAGCKPPPYCRYPRGRQPFLPGHWWIFETTMPSTIQCLQAGSPSELALQQRRDEPLVFTVKFLRKITNIREKIKVDHGNDGIILIVMVCDMDSLLCRAYVTNSGEYNSAENVVTSQFRYNTLGHMKIDYSSNWNNLDKYICQV